MKLNLEGVLSNLEDIFSANTNLGPPVFVEADADIAGDGLDNAEAGFE